MQEPSVQDSAGLLDLLFDDRATGRCLVAPDGTILRANDEWVRSTGLSLDRVLGSDIVDLFPDAAEMTLALHARARAGHHVDVPRHARRVDGRETWWEGSIDPVPMDGGIGLLITARATGGASSHETTARLAAIVESSEDAIVSKDLAGTILTWNPAAERLFGYRAGEVVGRSIAVIIPPERRGEERDILARVGKGERVERFETQRVTKDGVVLEVSITVTPVRDRDGRITAASKIARDVTQQKRVEAALRETEARYRHLFDSIDEGFCVIEVLFDDAGKPLDYRFLEVNRAFERQTGLVDATGRRMRDLAPAHEAHWFETYGRVALTGEPVRFQNRADALGRWYSVYAFRVGEPERRTVAVLFDDVTERHRSDEALRLSEERLRLALAGSQSGMFDWDVKVDATHWSEELLALYGRPPGGELGGCYEDWVDCLVPEDRQAGAAAVKRALETGEFALDFRIRRRDTGELRWMHGRAQVYFDAAGRPERMVGINVDITERKRADEALRHAHEELRDSDRRKSEFLAVLSHELRNPLAPIRNSLYLLERARPGSEQARRAKDVVHRQAAHLTRLVDDLLDVTRISRGKISLQRARVDLREIVRRTTDDLLSVFADAGVELRVDHRTPGPLWIDADPTRIAQVLGNLLQNAVKFTPNGGSVTVSLAAKGHRAELGVHDDGVGMEPDAIEHMFEPFAQADQSLARSAGGLGLGLSLVKGLVELHGGSVHARSDGHGRGSEFRVSIPLLEAGADRERDASADRTTDAC